MPGVHQQHNRKCKHKSLASSEIAYRRKRDKEKTRTNFVLLLEFMLASGQCSQRNKDFLSLRLRRKSRLVPSGHIYFRKGKWKRKLTRTKASFLPLNHRDLTKSLPLITARILVRVYR